MSSHPVPTVGVVCLRGAEVLLIRRGTPPRLNQWSLPGGRLEWGETLQVAALRELKEETSVDAELLGLIDVVDGVFPARPSLDGKGGGEITRATTC
jgi:8-oxo-dGTP diphosphatase